MTRPAICRYVSVSCKLLSVVSCRHGLPGSLEKVVLPFSSTSLVNCKSVFCLLRWWCIDFVVSYGGESIVNVV